MSKFYIMKRLIQLFLVVLLFASCSTYQVVGQSPYQYTSVSEQVVIDDPFTPAPIDFISINYVPTFSFVTYYNYYWWRPNRIWYYHMYSSPYSWYSYNWGWNYNPYLWNPYNNWYGWNNGWCHNNWYGWNNGWHHNNWQNPYNPYFNPVCHSPFYKQNTNQWKQSLKSPNVNLTKLAEKPKPYTSVPVRKTNYLSDNTPVHKTQDLRNYNTDVYKKPQYSNSEPVRQSKPEPVRYESKPTRTEYRQENRTTQTPRYETQRNNYQPKTRVESPRYDYRPTNRPSYNQSPRISSPSPRPSRSTYQPRMSSPSRNYSSPSRQSMGVKKGTR